MWPRDQLAYRMTADYSFNDILTAAARGWCERKGDEGALSLALPLCGVDPLKQLPLLAENNTDNHTVHVNKYKSMHP